MRKSNLTYEQLIELAPKDRPFQIEVIFSAVSEFPISYWANMFNGKKLKTFWLEDFNWENDYKGTFTLIDEYRNMYEKPEVLEVGTEVEILESGANCRYVATWENIIDEVRDDDYGIYYLINGYTFPYYCVRSVEKVEEKEEIKGIPGFDGMIEEFEGLCIKAQDIISKYKK